MTRAKAVQPAQEQEAPEQDGASERGQKIRLVAYTKTGPVHLRDEANGDGKWHFPTLVRMRDGVEVPGTLCGCPSPKAGKYATDELVPLATANDKVDCRYCVALIAKMQTPVADEPETSNAEEAGAQDGDGEAEDKADGDERESEDE